MPLDKYSDREIVAELFRRIDEPLPNDNKEWTLKQDTRNPKITGYPCFFTVFRFEENTLTEVGSYE